MYCVSTHLSVMDYPTEKEGNIESGALLHSLSHIQHGGSRSFLDLRNWRVRVAMFALIVAICLVTAVIVLSFTPSMMDDVPTKFRIHIISDDDQASKVDGSKPHWESHFWTGTLELDEFDSYTFQWDRKAAFSTRTNEADRAMELSELLFYRGRLLACDDRTGLVYEIKEVDGAPQALTRYVLLEGDGQSSNKGFKCEWATIYHGDAIFGSFGKEFADPKTGAFMHSKPMWVKRLEKDTDRITSIDWEPVYEKLREKTHTQFPGYLLHEAVGWSDFHKAWFFVPRRESQSPYSEKKDMSNGTDLILIADEKFKKIEELRIESMLIPKRGFSSFKFIPGRPNDIIALRTEEDTDDEGRGRLMSYISILHIDRARKKISVIMPESAIEPLPHKFEGIEIEEIL
ncbi:soluble calcium-activated nucleotidase [Carpediemonas membranifera]|uniref:Soluble calcium-activated nucleotidase n=1 Tax=Carpediemonas membranifera TaxID=201153 RepID=A0A8J6E4K3_9EUKA|nr:soluble calcium-activated nucleotidase [Carpediemonas membranifera]|eukprot:KAG9394582.1 soluble calcium-activated nucleotidase [Carpediemonas membranifera]